MTDPIWAGLRALEGNCLQQGFLHGVFGVLTVAADLHAEGKDRALQQSQRLLHGIGPVLLKDFQRSLNLGAHRGISPATGAD